MFILHYQADWSKDDGIKYFNNLAKWLGYENCYYTKVLHDHKDGCKLERNREIKLTTQCRHIATTTKIKQSSLLKHDLSSSSSSSQQQKNSSINTNNSDTTLFHDKLKLFFYTIGFQSIVLLLIIYQRKS